MAEKILVIDDNEELLRIIRKALEHKGFEVYTALSGKEGLKEFHHVVPDLVILDIMMPGMSGWEVCRELRRISSVPILMLTALGEEEHKVRGLEEGADDYLVKPFSTAELVARINALLRRARMPPRPMDVLRFGGGDLIINRTEGKVFAYGQEVELSPIEYNLLLYMAERAGRILTPEKLFEAIWGFSADASIQSVKWYIWSLRRKIESDPRNPRFILTERGRGYRFSPE
ncbi:MAG: DNA-binding response regulator [Chloroflexi bacterium]|nr:MAG: DNA-binding response regulator [Chloroflexota bacterium]HDN80076.1 response regulator transcription factor [Chloroflexota bacterium]